MAKATERLVNILDAERQALDAAERLYELDPQRAMRLFEEMRQVAARLEKARAGICINLPTKVGDRMMDEYAAKVREEDRLRRQCPSIPEPEHQDRETSLRDPYPRVVMDKEEPPNAPSDG